MLETRVNVGSVEWTVPRDVVAREERVARVEHVFRECLEKSGGPCRRRGCGSSNIICTISGGFDQPESELKAKAAWEVWSTRLFQSMNSSISMEVCQTKTDTSRERIMSVAPLHSV